MLTEDQNTLLDEMLSAFEGKAVPLIYARLTDDQRADVQTLIIEGLAECRPPGHLGNSTHIIPSARARANAAG